MAKEKSTDTPSPVNTNICNSFSAELGAQVTFTFTPPNPTGCKLEKCQATDTWPFVKADGTSYGPPISLPVTSNQYIYVNSNLTVGQAYDYCTSNNCGCAGEATKTVTIIDNLSKRPK